MRYIFVTKEFESSALALYMKLMEKVDVKVICKEKEAGCILEGIMEKEETYLPYLKQGNIFITDDASSGEEADQLRKMGEIVFGGNKTSDRFENERSYGQSIMKKVGFKTAKSINFKGHEATDKAKEFLKKVKGRWVIKQNGEADKSISCVGKFDDATDVIDRLEDLAHSWTENVDFDLQVAVDGVEVAVEGWFNGKDWIRDKDGKEQFLCNIEYKKLCNGDIGRTTGEMGTLGFKIKHDCKLSKELLKFTSYLKEIKYIGNFDINCMLATEENPRFGIKKGDLIGLEGTNRFGYPMLNLQQEMFKTPFSRLLAGCARGENNFFEVKTGCGVVVVVAVPPFPYSSDKTSNNAKGQRIYFMDNGKWAGKESFSTEKLRHMHFYEVKLEKETKHYLATGNTGYLLTVTGQAESPVKANQKCLDFIKANIHTGNMQYRTDIGDNERTVKTFKALRDYAYL